MAVSSAYITPEGYTGSFYFDGVIEVEYNFALNIDADPEKDADVVNGARKLPSQVRLSVVATDVNRGTGGAAKLLQTMDRLRADRTLCRVVTALGTWDNMLLTEITAAMDEINQCGWSGDLVFMQYVEKKSSDVGSSESSTRKTENNSSTRKNTGTKAAATVVTGAAFRQILARSGVSWKVLIN